MTEAQKIKKPDWIKVRAPQGKAVEQLNKMMRTKSLHTVCEEASCPNLGNCWKEGHAAFMILGDTCTRACAFCNVKTGNPKGVIDLLEPENIAISVKQMNLSHVVITSVDRDDLPDGGAQHFANTINAVRKSNPQTTIEVLTPDFRNKDGALEIVVKAKPDIYNHNLETVPRLYNTIRRGARYFHSLNLLNNVKKIDSNIFSKSGIMLGLGETKEEILQVMDDMRSADIDFITIGQYLQPTPKHAKVVEFVTPKRFKEYERLAYTKGFSMVSSSPLTRSSYFAGDDFMKLKSNKIKLT